jgi:hypothetical protein
LLELAPDFDAGCDGLGLGRGDGFNGGFAHASAAVSIKTYRDCTK